MTKKSRGQGIGFGHGGNANLPVIRPVEDTLALIMMKYSGDIESETKAYRMGKAYILVSPPTEISK